MTISPTDNLLPLRFSLATARVDEDVVVLSQAAANSAAVAVPPSPVSPSPSTIVTLNATPAQKAADTYPQPLVDIIQVRNQQDKTPAAAKLSNQLISSLSSIRANTSPFSVATLFSQVGNLSRETTEYRNEARSMAVASNKLNDKLKVDFSTSKGTFDQWVNFSVRSKEGDDIAVTVSRFRGDNGDSLEFTFTVTGELSDAEKDALDKLAAKLGVVADDFFRTGTAELNGLKEFDKDTLESFHIDFSRERGANAVSMSFDYKYDEQAQTQQLTAKDAGGYSIDIKANLQGLLVEGGTSANDSLQQYLRLIDKALTENNTASASRRFIMDGFSSLITPEAAVTAAPTKAEEIVDAFASGLADFKAIIQAPLHRDRNNYLFPEALTLQLEQKTRVEQAGERTLIEQTSSYELNSSRIKGRAGGEEGDLKSGNFNYKVIHMKEQTTRLLDMTDDNVNNAYREHESSLDIQEQKFGQFHLEDTQRENKQEHTLTQLRDAIAVKQLQKNSIDTVALLGKDKQSLFIL